MKKVNDVVNILSKKFSSESRPFPTKELIKLADAKLDVCEVIERRLAALDLEEEIAAEEDIAAVLMNSHFLREEADDVLDFIDFIHNAT